MVRTKGQGQGRRYAAIGVLACALAGFSPLASADDTQATPAVSSDLEVTGAPVTLAVAPPTAAAARQEPAIAAPPAPQTAPPETAVPAPAAKPAAEDDTQSASNPGEGAGDGTRHGNGGILALHSDIKFGFLSAPRQSGEQAVANAAFAAQVKRIAATLQTSAKGLYPDAMARIGSFDVYVAASDDLDTMSSGSGRIAINSGIAKLNPTDDWLAFVIAREMGHVVAGHHDSNAGASLVVSIVMNLIVPGSGLIKSAISFAGSQMAAESNRGKQLKEADEAAMKLLEGAGYTSKSVALNLKLGPVSEETSKGSWAASFRTSARNLIEAVDGPRAAGPVLVIAPAQAQTFVGMSQSQAPGGLPVVAPPATSAPLAVARTGRWQPEDVLVPTRPSGLQGPLLSGGFAMPVRRIE